ncbi:MAG: VOC family protein [Pseudomonadota bacterium]
MTAAPIMFFDIAGPDEQALRTFYADVFGWDCKGSAPFAPGNAVSLQGTFRSDPAEKLFYIGVPDIAATVEEIVAAGGSIEKGRFEVPGIAALGLFFDPAGNKFGLIEMDGDELFVPGR